MPYHRFGRHSAVFTKHRAKKLKRIRQKRKYRPSRNQNYPVYKTWVSLKNPHTYSILNPKLLEHLLKTCGEVYGKGTNRS